MSENQGLLFINLSKKPGANKKNFTSMVSGTGKYTNTLYPVLRKIAEGPEQHEKRLLKRTRANKSAIEWEAK